MATSSSPERWVLPRSDYRVGFLADGAIRAVSGGMRLLEAAEFIESATIDNPEEYQLVILPPEPAFIQPTG